MVGSSQNYIIKIIKDRSKTVFALGLVGLGASVVVAITLLALLFYKRRVQAVRQRSPSLMALSVTGNFLFTLAMLFQGLFFSGCMMDGFDTDQQGVLVCHDSICNSEAISSICCLLGIVALLVFEPMSLIPYWCRSLRIYVIYKA
jgi:hypothetical protein